MPVKDEATMSNLQTMRIFRDFNARTYRSWGGGDETPSQGFHSINV